MTQKAIVCPIPFGEFEIQGLMLPDGTFAIGVSQVAELFSFDKNQASRKLKVLLQKGFQFDKIASELNNKKVNILSLEEFVLVTQALAKKGNPQAKNFAILTMGLSLHQLWCDAFGIRFENEERQEWIKQRMIHRKLYHDRFTPWTKHDLEEQGITDKKEKGIIYGSRMNQLKLKVGLPTVFLGTYDSDQLQLLNDTELRYATMRECGLDHKEAMDRV